MPIRLVDTALMETASDDWFADFNNDSQPEIAIGRLPVSTKEEAELVVSKIIAPKNMSGGRAYRQMVINNARIGDALKQAKAATTSMNVRRTWVLLGDPTMRLR